MGEKSVIISWYTNAFFNFFIPLFRLPNERFVLSMLRCISSQCSPISDILCLHAFRLIYNQICETLYLGKFLSL